MATDALTIGPGLTLDVDFIAGARIALLGKRGAGKTYTCRKLAEELVTAGVQSVIIDPMGVFWGLRSSADGTQEGSRSRSSAASTVMLRSSQELAA